MCVCVHACVRAHATVCLWRSENNLWRLVLSFHHVNPGIQTGHQIRQLMPVLSEQSFQSLILFLIKKVPQTTVLTDE